MENTTISKERDPKKTKKIILIVLFSLIGIIIALVIAFVAIVNHYFDKIVYSPNDRNLVYVDVSHPKDTDDPDNVDVKKEEQNILQNLDRDMMKHPDVYNVLLIGRDTANLSENGRSDAMLLLSINQNAKTVKLVSFQRDIYAHIKNKGFDKLTHAHSYAGANLCMETIEDNFHVKIDNYISTNFITFQKIVDIIGGIDLTITPQEAKTLKENLNRQGYNATSGGTYHADGTTALAYCRIRYLDSDRDRTQRHRNVLNAIFAQVDNVELNVTDTINILEKCLPFVNTNIPKNELMEMTANSLNFLKWERSEIAIPLLDSSYDATIRGMFVVTLDWERNVDALQEYLYGNLLHTEN